MDNINFSDFIKVTFQCKIAINFMTFQNNKMKNSAKMSKSHILAEFF